MLRSVSSPVRAGFTLIELLIVIAIIGILVALLSMAVFGVLSKGPDVRDVFDIQQLQEALAKFKEKHHCYPPDYVKLCHSIGDYDPNIPLDAYSLQILQKIWPSVFKAKTGSDPVPANNWAVPWAGFNPDWTVKPLPLHPVTNKRCVVLQGDQCLVFFLGGVAGVRGFSQSITLPIHDPAPQSDTGVPNPYFTVGGQYTKVSYYTFPDTRLFVRPVKQPATTVWSPWTNDMPEFPSFFDNFATENPLLDKPYVYFVGGNDVNNLKGYNPFLFVPPFNVKSKIADLGGVEPYYEGKKLDAKGRPRDYYRPDTFQIIAAGKDKLFGPIGQWAAGESTAAGPNEDWKDNRTNFHDKLLGK